ncbi:hypothetical protein L798_04136 [Zootermopsis nevadensis]|uniref:Uncharacterized protein n=2 Tax=Zootermopsis nevadensis TaxID=136037 RepID=A0A067QFR9_ZOONE|nr:hypothetical protein L798_04136 [Zootermopsis nevadensis]
MADVPDHWCHVREFMDLPGRSPQDRRQLAIPIEEKSNLTFSQCLRYAVNWTALLQTHSLAEIAPNESWPVEPCSTG